jgi:hypothetical protein
MKHFLFTLLLLFAANTLLAQNSEGIADDAARIPIKAYVPTDIGDITPEAQSALKTRIERIITKAGLGGSSYDNRFIMTAKIAELAKEVSSTTPTIYYYELEITLLIGDAIAGTLFASQTINTKGAGPSHTKAYLAAIKKIKDQDPLYTEFVEKAKVKIIEYYNSKCDFILKEAESLSSQSDFEGAISVLTSVPDVCKDCYNKAMTAVSPIYQKQIDKQCKIDMMEAQNAWNAGQDEAAAKKASVFLGAIDPNSACYSDAQGLSNTIAKRIQALDERAQDAEKREWEFKLKQQADAVNLEKSRISAARAIGVAKAQNQPKTKIVYNIRSWWY